MRCGKSAIDNAGGNVDLIIPALITRIMPDWFIYLFMLGLLAATMSTAAALLHMQGMSLARDIVGVWLPAGRREKALIRAGSLFGLALALVLGFVLPGSIIARATALWYGLCAICWLPAFVGCLFWKGSTRAGALASVAAGFVFTVIWYAFFKASEAVPLGICRALTGKDTLAGHPWSGMDPLIIGIPLTALIFWSVSLITKKPDKDALDRLFTGI